MLFAHLYFEGISFTEPHWLLQDFSMIAPRRRHMEKRLSVYAPPAYSRGERIVLSIAFVCCLLFDAWFCLGAYGKGGVATVEYASSIDQAEAEGVRFYLNNHGRKTPITKTYYDLVTKTMIVVIVFGTFGWTTILFLATWKMKPLLSNKGRGEALINAVLFPNKGAGPIVNALKIAFLLFLGFSLLLLAVVKVSPVYGPAGSLAPDAEAEMQFVAFVFGSMLIALLCGTLASAWNERQSGRKRRHSHGSRCRELDHDA